METSCAATLAREFADRSVHHLREEYLPRLERACDRLAPGDLWWRPNETSTSAGNLLLHLEGNVRQWILCGLGDVTDSRRRSTEFSAREGLDAPALLRPLRETVEAACEIVGQLDPDALLRRYDIQVFEGVTGLGAVLHVVEHFAWHTGQIAWIAKARSGEDLGYYDDTSLE